MKDEREGTGPVLYQKLGSGSLRARLFPGNTVKDLFGSPVVPDSSTNCRELVNTFLNEPPSVPFYSGDPTVTLYGNGRDRPSDYRFGRPLDREDGDFPDWTSVIVGVSSRSVETSSPEGMSVDLLLWVRGRFTSFVLTRKFFSDPFSLLGGQEGGGFPTGFVICRPFPPSRVSPSTRP